MTSLSVILRTNVSVHDALAYYLARHLGTRIHAWYGMLPGIDISAVLSHDHIDIPGIAQNSHSAWVPILCIHWRDPCWVWTAETDVMPVTGYGLAAGRGMSHHYGGVSVPPPHRLL
jgi:hypothetical protein